jgi:hypothetical protein
MNLYCIHLSNFAITEKIKISQLRSRFLISDVCFLFDDVVESRWPKSELRCFKLTEKLHTFNICPAEVDRSMGVDYN